MQSTHRSLPTSPAGAGLARRTFLQWVNAALGAVVATLVGLPGLRYLLGAISGSRQDEPLVRRVARLDALPPGQPVLVTITGRKQDGWATYADQPLGRIWLLRREEAADASTVLALSATCPHLGCTVGMARDGAAFECPCHRAVFAFDGRRLQRKDGTPNHAPRDLDVLPVRLVRDEASGVTWVEVTYLTHEPGLSEQRPAS